MNRKLKLFVWEGYCPDYTQGLAVALAETVEEAREMLCESEGRKYKDFLKWRESRLHNAPGSYIFGEIDMEPDVYESKFVKSVHGGS